MSPECLTFPTTSRLFVPWCTHSSVGDPNSGSSLEVPKLWVLAKSLFPEPRFRCHGLWCARSSIEFGLSFEVGREDWPAGCESLGRLQLASSHFQGCHGSRDLGILKYVSKMTGRPYLVCSFSDRLRDECAKCCSDLSCKMLQALLALHVFFPFPIAWLMKEEEPPMFRTHWLKGPKRTPEYGHRSMHSVLTRRTGLLILMMSKITVFHFSSWTTAFFCLKTGYPIGLGKTHPQTGDILGYDLIIILEWP